MARKPRGKGEDGAAPGIRTEQGRFAPGCSGNPRGRPRKLGEVDDAIRKNELPRVLDVLEVLREKVLSGEEDAVAAADKWLSYVLGKPKVRQESRPEVTAPAPLGSVLELRERLLNIVHAEAVALEAAQRERGLTPDEGAALVSYLRALSSDKPENLSDTELKRLVGLDAAGVASKG